MKIDLNKTISEIAKTRSLPRLAHQCRNGLVKSNINHVTYVLLKPGVPFKDALVSSTYPKEWQARYLERSYASIDPVFISCRLSVMPVNWSHVRPPSTDGGLLLQEAVDLGVGRTGLSVPVRGPDGTFAIASFTTQDEYENIFDDLHFQSNLVLIAFYMHAQAASMFGLNEIKSALTPREIEIAGLIATGKTVKEISTLLSLSISTVRFHLDNCRERLGSPTVRGAVAKAVWLGLVRAG
jgi:DNA-binding CsgD family transcriptional regulator